MLHRGRDACQFTLQSGRQFRALAAKWVRYSGVQNPDTCAVTPTLYTDWISLPESPGIWNWGNVQKCRCRRRPKPSVSLCWEKLNVKSSPSRVRRGENKERGGELPKFHCFLCCASKTEGIAWKAFLRISETDHSPFSGGCHSGWGTSPPCTEQPEPCPLPGSPTSPQCRGARLPRAALAQLYAHPSGRDTRCLALSLLGGGGSNLFQRNYCTYWEADSRETTYKATSTHFFLVPPLTAPGCWLQVLTAEHPLSGSWVSIPTGTAPLPPNLQGACLQPPSTLAHGRETCAVHQSHPKGKPTETLVKLSPDLQTELKQQVCSAAWFSARSVLLALQREKIGSKAVA